MIVFVDTSAILAILDEAEPNHLLADQIWQRLLDENDELFSTNYIVTEAVAVLQRRSGMPVIRAFIEQMVPVFQLEWIDRPVHMVAAQAFLLANRRQLSLVDCVSFVTMNRLAITTAFAFDQHFVQ